MSLRVFSVPDDLEECLEARAAFLRSCFAFFVTTFFAASFLRSSYFETRFAVSTIFCSPV